MLIIGELINTSRKLIREAIEKKDGNYIQQIAKKQEEAGANYIDVNCGTFMQTEVETMEWLVENILQATELPLCIDSPNPLALEAGLKKVKNGKPMINSITGEDKRWNTILPLVKQFNSKIIALCIDNIGMPKTQEDRLRIADSLITKLTGEGIALDDIYIDPLIKPISAAQDNGIDVLAAIQKIMESYPGVHTTCGLSNISYSLPARKVLNRLFMVQTMARGMDSYIMDPTNNEMRGALLASQTLLGQDRFSRKFIKAFREGLYESSLEDYMSNAKTVVVACRTIEEELNRAVNEIDCDYPILWIESGLHLDTGELRKCIQKKLDSISNVDKVLLAFGYCGNAVIGLKSLDYKLIFPRVDDCITLLLGSSERRKNISNEKETYFLTKGWLNSERNIWAEYKATVKKFGKNKADKVYKIMLGNYERLGVIETGTCETEDFIKKTRQIAVDLKLKQEVISGTISYIKKLLTGPWDDEFVIINPYETISMEHIYGR